MELIEILELADTLVTFVANAGVDFQQYQAMKAKAKAEGRKLTVEEYRALGVAADQAIADI